LRKNKDAQHNRYDSVRRLPALLRRGFTGFSESSDPEDVMALLREYHAAIGEIFIKYSGTLERYAGDSRIGARTDGGGPYQTCDSQISRRRACRS
jgi:class 3 adenylate cyclase